MADGQATRVMVFLSEDDRFGHGAAADELVARARRQGIAGITVWRGVEGFGAGGHLRTTRFPDVADGLPLAVEVVDAPERVAEFVAAVAEVVPGALVTQEEVRVLWPGPGA